MNIWKGNAKNWMVNLKTMGNGVTLIIKVALPILKLDPRHYKMKCS